MTGDALYAQLASGLDQVEELLHEIRDLLVERERPDRGV